MFCGFVSAFIRTKKSFFKHKNVNFSKIEDVKLNFG